MFPCWAATDMHSLQWDLVRVELLHEVSFDSVHRLKMRSEWDFQATLCDWCALHCAHHLPDEPPGILEIGGEFDCLRLFQLECCNYMSVVTFSKQKNSGDEKLQVPKHYNKISCRHPGMLSEFIFVFCVPSTPRKSQNIKKKQRKGRKHISQESHLQRPRVDSDGHNLVIFSL